MRHDVAIVGAGPAGAWAACCLARRGSSVLIIDPSHPREKPCGGGITGRALEIVADTVDLKQLPSTVVRGAQFSASSTPAGAIVPLEANALVVASRTEFDLLILDAARRAGARLVRARAIGVQPGHGGFEIETSAGTHRARFLIGADGTNSLVRKRLAGGFRRDQLSVATGFFAHGVTSSEILVELLADPPGYIWSFPRPTHLAIGICAQADDGTTAPALRKTAAAWIARTGIANGAHLESYSWPIPTLSARDLDALKPSGPDWCLIGDAAGLVDPLTREGIYFALLSAQWAADALSADAPRRYATQVRDGIGTELARAARLKSAFFGPQFTRLMVEALRSSAAIRSVMSDLVAGRQDYASLKWRLATTFEWRLAARLLFTLRIPSARVTLGLT